MAGKKSMSCHPRNFRGDINVALIVRRDLPRTADIMARGLLGLSLAL